MKECDILIRSLKDSAANSKLKLLKKGETFGIEKPGGEKRIHIGSMTEEKEWDSFFFPNGEETVNVIVSKIDLIEYILEAENEYLNPQQSYRLNISDFYDSLYMDTLNIPLESFEICFEKNIDKKRYYLTRPSYNNLSKNYEYIINICLPIITKYVFLRVKSEDSYKFYFKPIFRPDFVIPESSNNVSRENNLQQIFYGAPGTGKSNTIKREVDEKKKKHFRTTFHPDSDYSTFVGAYKPTMKPVADKYKAVAGKDEEITYSFVPQAFTKAYIEAWNTEEEVYLIIEEINRGNCAQIFGDLFQLLDRDKNGESEYPIDADADLANYIADALNESPRDDISDEVKSGKKLKLPRNLYIWATMNTSDQSLFPIDSAFKRRWDWKYIPIKPHNENYIIEIDKTQYDWWGFLEKINYVIGKTTSSEDKKLGYFFVKANNNTIDADKFVSKVLFYIWNDVFKNYEFDHEIFNKGEDKKFSFSDFFEQDGKPNVNEVKEFLKNLDKTIDKENSFVIPNNQEKKEDNNNTGEEGTEE